MRFAYIDSHGNEVPIPSVDALALRIELGAVGPDTQLYDAQADHWGPAETHEIFHTLSRDAGGEDFVAPPPPVTPPPPPPDPEPPPPAAKPARAPKPPKKAKRKATDAPSSNDVDLGLTLADPPPPPPDGEPEKEPERDEAAAAGPADPDLDLAPPRVGTPTPPAAPAASAGGGFDFGDLGAGLELEEPDPPAGPGTGGSWELEAPMDLATGGVETGGAGDDLLLETPMSEFEPDAPPGWMEEEPVRDEVMDFSAVSADTAAQGEALVPPQQVPTRDRRTPKDRPSPPRFKRQRSLSGPIVFVVIVLALAVGGYVGWPILSARLARPDVPERPAVVMPAISAELLPRMRELAGQAISDAVEQVDVATTAAGAPLEPGQEWLAGIYLGNASRFSSVEEFWQGMGSFVDGLRSGDWQVYHDALVARVEAAGLSADEAAIIVERADSGFVAAEERRREAYDAMDRLVVASLDLHDFLLDNEASIQYQPAGSSTADPVLEAVPSTQAIGDRMWEMVEAITESLDALGSLDRVTRERLTAALRGRLQEVGVE